MLFCLGLVWFSSQSREKVGEVEETLLAGVPSSTGLSCVLDTVVGWAMGREGRQPDTFRLKTAVLPLGIRT